MASASSNLPIYILSSIVILGAFSRITHGIYTPQFYAFQEYHAPDDGSTLAQITPIMDTLIGMSLLLGSKAVRLGAASMAFGFFCMGLLMQLQSGKQYLADLALVASAGIAVLSQLRR